MVKLAGMLGPDFIDNAQWYVSSSTYFNWLLSLKDDQKRPILDPSKPILNKPRLGIVFGLTAKFPPTLCILETAAGSISTMRDSLKSICGQTLIPTPKKPEFVALQVPLLRLEVS